MKLTPIIVNEDTPFHPYDIKELPTSKKDVIDFYTWDERNNYDQAMYELIKVKMANENKESETPDIVKLHNIAQVAVNMEKGKPITLRQIFEIPIPRRAYYKKSDPDGLYIKTLLGQVYRYDDQQLFKYFEFYQNHCVESDIRDVLNMEIQMENNEQGKKCPVYIPLHGSLLHAYSVYQFLPGKNDYINLQVK